MHVDQEAGVHACELVYMHVHQKCIHTATEILNIFDKATRSLGAIYR